MPAKSVGAIALDMNLNYKPFQQQMNGIGKKASGLAGSMMGKIGAVAGAAMLGKMAIGFGKDAIKLASDLNEVQNVVDVTFGSMAGQINSFAKGAIDSFGISELAAKRYTGTFGAMVKSMGITGQAGAEMSKSVAGLAGDFASFYNISSEDAFMKIRSGISGESEPLKQLGILINDTTVAEYLRAQGITKSFQAMTQAEKAMYRYQLLMKSSADAQGDFARTSDSWANQVRVLSLRFDEFKSSVGQGLMTMFLPMIKILNAVIAKLTIAGQAFSRFMALMMGTKTATASGAKAAATLNNTLGGTAEKQDDVADSTKAATKAIKGSLASFDKLNIVGSEDGSSDASTAIPDMASSFDAGGIDSATEDAGASVDAFAAKVQGVFSTIKATSLSLYSQCLQKPFQQMSVFLQDTILPGLSNSFGIWWTGMGSMTQAYSSLMGSYLSTMWVSFTDALPGMLEQAGTTFEFLNGIFQSGFAFISTVVTEGLGIVQSLWDRFGKGILDGTWAALTGVWGYFNMILNQWIKPVFENVLGFLKELWDNHLKSMIDRVGTFVGKLIQAALDIYNNFVLPIMKWLVEKLAPIFVAVWTTIGGIITTTFGIISDIVGAIFRVLSGLLDFIMGVFTGDWQRAWNGIKDIFGGIWDAITGVFGGVASYFKVVWDGIKSVFTTVMNWIISGLNKVISGILAPINDVIRGLNKVPGVEIPTVSLNIAKIPALAQGGIVSQPTLAMVGDNKRSSEVVAPLHELQGMLGLSDKNGDMDAVLAVLRMILDVIKGMETDVSVYFGTEKLENMYEVRKARKQVRAGRMISAKG